MIDKRCAWVKLNDAQYVRYHDEEWGRPIHSDQELFELFSLETQAAGLSWLTILKKRDAYRKQFKQFNVNKVASLTSEDVEHIMQSDVVKHKKKIEAIVNNAKLFQDIITEYNSINSFFWSYVNYESIIIKMENYSKNQTRSDISDQLTKDLKKRGFKFVGSVTMYAFMQASGMINAHEIDCICSRKLLK